MAYDRMNNHSRILLVEDEAIIALNGKMALETQGHEVICVHSGETAVEKVIDDPGITLVLMDIDLGPGIDGTEAARQILEIRSIPLLFLTNHSEEEYVQRAKTITHYGYVLKSSGEFVLRESVEMAYKLFDSHEQLRKREEQLRLAMDATDHGYWEWDLETGDVDTSPRFAEMLGYDPETFSMSYDLWKQLLHPDDWEASVRYVEDRIERGEPFDLEFRLYTGSGACRWFRTKGKIFHVDHSGRPKRVVGTQEDISLQKESEQELEANFNRLQRIVDTVPFFIHEFDPDGHYILANENTCRYLGVSKDALIGSHFRDVIPEEFAGIFEQRLNHVVTTAEELTVDDRMNLDGEARVFRTVLCPICEQDQRVQSVIGLAYDVTQEVDRFRFKDFLVREMNHRIKNNLNLLSSLIELKASDAGGTFDLSDLKHQVQAIAKVHAALQARDEITHIELRPYLEEVLGGVFQSYHADTVNVRVTIPDISVRTNVAVTIGLIINETATNAMKHAFTPDERAQFHVAMEADSAGEHYILTISNSGNPLPDDIDLENPAGLGLTLITALSSQLRGELTVDRNPGTRFTVRFPVSVLG